MREYVFACKMIQLIHLQTLSNAVIIDFLILALKYASFTTLYMLLIKNSMYMPRSRITEPIEKGFYQWHIHPVVILFVCFFSIHLIYSFHDDVIKWKHFRRYWPFVRGIHRWPVNSPYTGQRRGALMFSLICAWINGSVNNREDVWFETPSRPLWRHCNVL